MTFLPFFPLVIDPTPIEEVEAFVILPASNSWTSLAISSLVRISVGLEVTLSVSPLSESLSSDDFLSPPSIPPNKPPAPPAASALAPPLNKLDNAPMTPPPACSSEFFISSGVIAPVTLGIEVVVPEPFSSIPFILSKYPPSPNIACLKPEAILRVNAVCL